MVSDRHAVADPANSYAVLIGTSQYEDPSYQDEQLPAVANNVSRLAWMLRDPSLWGLPAENCVEVLNPRSPDEIIGPIEKAAANATGTLLVYFAGHGLISPVNARLYLAYALSVKSRPVTAVDFDHVRSALTFLDVPSRILILDCCFAGNATLMGPAEGQVAIDGTFVLAATPPNHPAIGTGPDGFTAFTGELVALLRNGVPGAGEYLSMGTLSSALEQRMARKGLPQPHPRADGNIGNLALFGNWADHGFVDTEIGTPFVPPEPPPPPPPPRGEWSAPPGIVLAVVFGCLGAAVLAGRRPVEWVVAAGLSTALVVYLVRVAVALTLVRADTSES